MSDSDDRPWPSRFGTLGEAVFGKDDPFNYQSSAVDSLNHFSSDEIPPTRSPISGKYYTSKSALRAEYKAHGAEEIGTAYDHGYDPQPAREREISERNRQAFRSIAHEYFRGDRNARSILNRPIDRATLERLRRNHGG